MTSLLVYVGLGRKPKLVFSRKGSFDVVSVCEVMFMNIRMYFEYRIYLVSSIAFLELTGSGAITGEQMVKMALFR